MIKRLLLVLDPDPSNRTSTRYALEIAQRYESVITGLAVVDARELPSEMASSIWGSMQSGKELEEDVRIEARERIKSFKTYLDERQVDHTEGIEEGVPFKRICESSKYHDLVVIGHESELFSVWSENRLKTLARIVKNGTAPVLITPPVYSEVKYVVAAFDGSVTAARTLQQFAHLKPFGRDIHIDIVHVRNSEEDEKKQESRLLLHLATQYLQQHNFTKIREVSMRLGSVPIQVNEHADKVGAQLLVLGAHSGSPVQRIAFGSATDELLDQKDRLLFVGH